MKNTGFLLALTWLGLWLTPDQEGQRRLLEGQFEDAAAAFKDPMWRGVALFRAAEFEKATQSFSRVTTPEARFNLGNAWVMLGKYDKAIETYEKVLAKRPNWKEAIENRDLAVARAKLIESKGGDLGDQKIGADEVVFDKKKQPGGQDTEVAGNQVMSDAAVQAIWLRQVQTKPADFLKTKFAFQHAQQNTEVTK